MHCNLSLIYFAISSLVKPSGAMIIGSVVMMTPTIQFIFHQRLLSYRFSICITRKCVKRIYCFCQNRNGRVLSV